MTGVDDPGQDRVDVALAVVVDIHDLLDDPAEQLAVIDDVIRHWRMLNDAGRQRYADTTNSASSGLMHFAHEYVNAIDEAAVADLAGPCSDDATKSARLRHWIEHVRRLRTASDRARTAASLHNSRMPINVPSKPAVEDAASCRDGDDQGLLPGRTTTVTAIESADAPSPDGDLPVAPLVEVCVALIPGLGLDVRRERCEGDLPLLEVITGHARLLITFDVADVRQLGAEHVTLTEQLAQAAAALHDETRKLVVSR